MSEALTVVPQVDAARAAVEPIVQAADTMLVVGNVEQHQAALALLVDVMAAETRVKRMFEPAIEAAKESKRKAEAARQEIVALQDSVLSAVTEARKTISAKCAAFEEAERKAAAEVQAQLNREAMARQDEQRELDAAMADTPAEAEKVLTQALPPPFVAVARPAVAKVVGVSTRETWSAEVTDLKAFYLWCLDTDNMYMAGEPNLIALNSRARAEHDKMSIPGVRAVSTLSHSRR